MALVFIVGPLWLSVAGARCAARERHSAVAPRVAHDWSQTLHSTLLYTLAFNLTFFLQELFLVVPKALTPGLRPTLFHNNHHWQGANPLAALWQGTGAAATLISSALCLLLLRHVQRSATLRQFLIWMAFSGAFMALPQVVIGAVSPPSDLGMAMGYLQLGAASRILLVLAALALMPVVGWRLAGEFLTTAAPARRASVRARRAFIFEVATLPALLAIPLIVLFRIPRGLIEVLAVPAVVSVAGVLWVQASAWRAAPRTVLPGRRNSMVYALAAVVLLLVVFQLVLRRGVAFY